MLASVAGGVLSGSSLKNMWVLFNQFQLYLILPFLKAELSLKFAQTLDALDESIFNINLLEIKSLSIFEPLIEYVDYENPYQEFKDNEYESGSALINCFDFLSYPFGITILVLLMHFPLRIICKKRNSPCLMKIYSYFCDAFYFQFYLRYFIEGFLFISLTSVSEVSRVSDASPNLISYSISALIVVLLILLMCLIPILYFSVKNPFENRYVKELFKGFKKNRLAQLYNFAFLLRRFLLVGVIVGLRPNNLMLRLSVFAILQILILIFTIMVRHHDEKYPNIIEVVNEVSYLVIILLIIFYQKSEMTIIEELLDNSIIGSSMLVFVISIINLIYQITLSCCLKKKNKITPSSKTILERKNTKSINDSKKNQITLGVRKQAENNKNEADPKPDDKTKAINTSSLRRLMPPKEITVYPLFKKSSFPTPTLLTQPPCSRPQIISSLRHHIKSSYPHIP
ncbi:unnamed protein product [Moneuplotes crassus]|uniref:TRP C-terminal domain-containing protein n=1 Tax=Euplotes crassus TaxID=5936 RepID=A0AAD1U6T7_EUPCR|nr:unnamed protein product [Moneuplotes crassus]